MAVSASKRILLAQRACVEGYPPTLNEAALLSELGAVTLLDAVSQTDSQRILTSASVKRLRIQRRPATSRARGALERLRWVRRFYGAFSRQLAKKPDVAIAYDPEAIFWLLRSQNLRGTIRIAHLHEMPIAEDVAATLVGSFALRATMKNLHRADLVVMPDKWRAQWVQEAAGLKETPLVVMNCPRLLSTLPTSRLMPFLRERGIETTRIVHYQGAIGSHHFFEPIIASMRFWPADSVFVIVGSVSADYGRQLRELAETEGVRERLVFVGRVPYDEVFSYAVGASVGVSFLNGEHLQWQLSAGASNKRFEYIALGIPQVTNDLTGVRELFEQTGVASIADENDVADIGAKISAYLENETLRRETGERARQLHLEHFNYEQQIKPLLEKISAL